MWYSFFISTAVSSLQYNEEPFIIQFYCMTRVVTFFRASACAIFLHYYIHVVYHKFFLSRGSVFACVFVEQQCFTLSVQTH